LARFRAALIGKGCTKEKRVNARGEVGWANRKESIDKLDQRAQNRTGRGRGRGFDEDTSIHIPYRPGTEEWWEEGCRDERGVEIPGACRKGIHGTKCACHVFENTKSRKDD